MNARATCTRTGRGADHTHDCNHLTSQLSTQKDTTWAGCLHCFFRALKRSWYSEVAATHTTVLTKRSSVGLTKTDLDRDIRFMHLVVSPELN
jgi:hypothetical protein